MKTVCVFVCVFVQKGGYIASDVWEDVKKKKQPQLF